ncbi:MAG: PAS domain-containing protein [Bacteroidales bacterium]|nr:PAS domain-containing protein [Bacteroidales bacterium]
MIDVIPDHIYAKDMDSKFLVANQSLATFLDMDSPDQLLGKDDKDFYPPDLAKEFMQEEKVVLKK